ncbi:MAG TPA: T9SS type A sorting domain-containing protein [Chitinophagaceae bacterium]|nr:T9SS type A sorting domain-containing protein [Chitinophagaceae bacterium]
MKKIYLSLLLLCVFVFTSYSQTQLFGGSNGNGNFENGSTDWVLVNGTQVNKWVVSNNATPGFTGNCIYISPSTAAPYSHGYITVAPTYSYFYKDVAIPAGTTTLWLLFDYIGNGQAVMTPDIGAGDALRIWARPTSETVVAGQQLNNVFISPGIGYYNYSTWGKVTQFLDVTGFAGSTMRIIFQWYNDGSGGTQPPAALDNIELYASCQQALLPLVSNGVTATTATVTWPEANGATGYEIRYRKESEPTSVSTYTNPISVAGGNSYLYVLNNLSPATAYRCEVRPTGTSCSEYSAPLIFNTLTPPANDVCSGAVALSVESNACEGTLGSFNGALPASLLSNSCGDAGKIDVWFKFNAQQTKQIIQTISEEPGLLYSAKNITLYSGTCDNLQPIVQPCATEVQSVPAFGKVSRLIADGLTQGTTYYVRVTAVIDDPIEAFKICVFNEPPLPQCPQLLTPANNSTINYGMNQEFKWTKSDDALAYKVKIIQQSGAYTEVNVYNTSILYSPAAGINYTWTVVPYNILDQTTTCSSFSFSTCASAANPSTITTTGSTAKCGTDSVKLTASSATNIQWFLNNQAIAGATSDIFWAKQPGNYTLRVLNGSCYSDPSNTIAITDLPTPIKPSLILSGALTFCEGGSVTLTSSLGNINNQWFKNTAAISGANGGSYNAATAGTFYLRVTNSTSGCPNYSDTANVVVNPIPATPTISAGSATTFCQGGSVVLTSSAALGNQWKLYSADISGETGATYTATASGNYRVSVTSNGCTSNISALTAVTVNPLPATPTITASGALTFCNGGSVTFTSNVASGNQWYNGTTSIVGATSSTYTATAQGTYSVKVTQSGCTSAGSNTFTVVVDPSLAVPTVSWNGSQLSTASGFVSYQWFLNGSSIPGATSAAHTPASSGLYKVTIAGANGCTATSTEFNLVATGITDVALNGVLYSISPNPAKANLFIKVQGNNPYKVQMRIINANGAEMMKRENVNQSTSIPVKHLSTGMYYVILTSKKEKATFKIIINN